MSSRCFLCAHEASYVWVSFCAHMYVCSNKILGNEPVTSYEREGIGTSKKQDGARQCRQHAHVREKRYSLPCEHKKHSEITGQRSCCGRACTPNGTATCCLCDLLPFKVFMVQTTRLCNLICGLGNTCGLFHGTWGCVCLYINIFFFFLAILWSPTFTFIIWS